MADIYTHGHHESVLRSHRWRTAENSAGYLLGELRAGMSVLDVGCGPGTITTDLAKRVAPGPVIGIDSAGAAIEAAAHDNTSANTTFAVGDVYALTYGEDSFDVVHAHQVLQHLTDPVRALREMRRVLKPTGVVAARDSDYSIFAWAPDDASLLRWQSLYRSIARRNHAEPDAGRYLLTWAHEAGFRDVRYTTSNWTFADDESRDWWGNLWADRMQQSTTAHQAVEYGLATEAELAEIATAFREWAGKPDGIFITVHGEILARP